MADFGAAFRQATADLPAIGSNIHYSESANRCGARSRRALAAVWRLRKLLREGPLKLTEPFLDLPFKSPL